MRKRIPCAIAALTLILSCILSACIGTAKDKTADGREIIHLKLCHTNPSDCATNEALQIFCDRVEEASDGRLVIDNYPDGVMGDDEQINEWIYQGCYMLNYVDPAQIESYYADYSILFAPYFYESREEVRELASTDFGKRLQRECREAGIMCLDGMSGYYGSRQIMSNKPIYTPADLKGLNFRMPNNAGQLELAEAWGANPVTISFSETYGALMQGVVDCVENPIGSLKANSIDEVCSYLNISNHYYAAIGMIMSTKVFDSLDSNLQEILIDESLALAEYGSDMVDIEEQEALTAMEAEGVTINRDVDMDAMKEAAMRVYEVHGWPQELIDEANDALGEIRR